MTEPTPPEVPREAMLRDLRTRPSDPELLSMPDGGFDPAARHPDLVERVAAMLDEHDDAAVARAAAAMREEVDADRLAGLGIEPTDVDPAPELSTGPEHWVAEALREKLQQRLDPTTPDLGPDEQMYAGLDIETIFKLVYETAIYDVVAITGDRAYETGVITPDGTRVPMGEERRAAAQAADVETTDMRDRLSAVD
jgi:hypothetical protein